MNKNGTVSSAAIPAIRQYAPENQVLLRLGRVVWVRILAVSSSAHLAPPVTQTTTATRASFVEAVLDAPPKMSLTALPKWPVSRFLPALSALPGLCARSHALPAIPPAKLHALPIALADAGAGASALRHAIAAITAIAVRIISRSSRGAGRS